MLERKTSQGAWEFTDTDTAGFLFVKQYMGYSKREARKRFRDDLRGYSLHFWADGYGVWHGRAEFCPALGNTWEADAVIDRARAALIRGMRNRIRARQVAPLGRMTWDTETGVNPSTNRIYSLTMKEGTK